MLSRLDKLFLTLGEHVSSDSLSLGGSRIYNESLFADARLVR